ncbi:MAG: dihydropteroate synthase [Thermoanaerobaculaceae bacterium]|nr:dihydropteroate synthase [Thermoanaerobaculaceae bacterium]
MSLPAHPHNAHLLDLRTPADLAGELAAVGFPAREPIAEWEQVSHAVLRLEGVRPAVRSRLESLAVNPESPVRLYGGGPNLLRSASRRALRGLAKALSAGGRPAAGAELERCLDAAPGQWRWGRRTLDFRSGAKVMGVLNCTPDSFYPASRLPEPGPALEAARAMIAAGAHILDVGGESSRPGSDPVPVAEEIRRVVPLLEAIRRESDVLLSIDTRKPEVAQAALEAGADILNDISALRADRSPGDGTPGMAALAARRGAPLVLMHMRGEPKTMQAEPRYEDVVSEVLGELSEMVEFAFAAGVERLIVDPGIGFGKRLADNLCLLKNLAVLRCLGCPVLVGLSRKSFLGAVTGAPVEDRLPASIAADTLAILSGADIVRVHDVREAVQTVRLLLAVRGASCR